TGSFGLTAELGKDLSLLGDDIKIVPSGDNDSITLTLDIEVKNWKLADIGATLGAALWFDSASADPIIDSLSSLVGTGIVLGKDGNAAKLLISSAGMKLDSLKASYDFHSTDSFAFGPITTQLNSLSFGLYPTDDDCGSVEWSDTSFHRCLEVSLVASPEINAMNCNMNSATATFGITTWLPFSSAPNFKISMSSADISCSAAGFSVEADNLHFQDSVESKSRFGLFADTLALIIDRKAILELADVDEPIYIKLFDLQVYKNSNDSLQVKKSGFRIGPTPKFAKKDFSISPLGITLKGSVDWLAPLVDKINEADEADLGITLDDLRLSTGSILGGKTFPTNMAIMLNTTSPYIHPRLSLSSLKLSIPTITLGGVGGSGSLEWAYHKQDSSYWTLGVEGNIAIPEIVDKAGLKLSLTKPNSENKTGIEEGTVTVVLTGAARIPLGSTGLYITGLSGSIYDGYGQPSLSTSCAVGDLPAGLKSQLMVFIVDQSGGEILDGQVGVWVQLKALNFGIDGEADLIKHAAHAAFCAALSNGVFRSKASVSLDAALSVKGDFQVDIWKSKGQNNLAGSATASLGLKKGSLLKKWFIKLPPSTKYFGGISTQFGRFSNGKNGFTSGFRLFKKTWGAGFIGGSFKLGGLGSYKLASPEDVSTSIDLDVDDNGETSLDLTWNGYEMTGNEEVVLIFGADQEDAAPTCHLDFYSDSLSTLVQETSVSAEEDTTTIGTGISIFRFSPPSGSKFVRITFGNLSGVSNAEVSTYASILMPSISGDLQANVTADDSLLFVATVNRYMDTAVARKNFYQDIEPVIFYRKASWVTPSGDTIPLELNVSDTNYADGISYDPLAALAEQDAALNIPLRWMPVPLGLFGAASDTGTRTERVCDTELSETSGNFGTLKFTCTVRDSLLESGAYEFGLGYRIRRYNPERSSDYESDTDSATTASDEILIPPEDSSSLADYFKTAGADTAFIALFYQTDPKVKALSAIHGAVSKWDTSWAGEDESRRVLLNWDNPNADLRRVYYRLRYWPNLANVDDDYSKTNYANVRYLGNTNHYEVDVPALISSSDSLTDSTLIAGVVSDSSDDYRNMLGASSYTFEVTPVKLERLQSVEDPGLVEVSFTEYDTISPITTVVNLEDKTIEGTQNRIASITPAKDTVRVPINKATVIALNLTVQNPGYDESEPSSYVELATRWVQSSSSTASSSSTNRPSLWNSPRAALNADEITFSSSSAAQQVELLVTTPRKSLLCSDVYPRQPYYERDESGEVLLDESGDPYPLSPDKALFYDDTTDASKIGYTWSNGNFVSVSSASSSKQLVGLGAWTDGDTVFRSGPCRSAFYNYEDSLVQEIPELGVYHLQVAAINREDRSEPVSAASAAKPAVYTDLAIRLVPPEVRLGNLSQVVLVKGRSFPLRFDVGDEINMLDSSLVQPYLQLLR
ncbi:MAG TPA: hypothetical protein VLM37_05960, partial [Fibrobacteraceae bacterium]|nr:hypothetical protein [Fibrobacteraceae bacterium]